MYSLFSLFDTPLSFPYRVAGPTLWMGWICLGIVSLGGRRPLLPLPLPPSKDTNTLPSLSRIIMHGYTLDRERKITHYYSREKKGERDIPLVYIVCMREQRPCQGREKYPFLHSRKCGGKHRCVFTKSGKRKKRYIFRPSRPAGKRKRKGAPLINPWPRCLFLFRGRWKKVRPLQPPLIPFYYILGCTNQPPPIPHMWVQSKSVNCPGGTISGAPQDRSESLFLLRGG